MSKILVVFGATGNQGGSVIRAVLNDSELSKQYKIRAITRDASKPAAKALSEKGINIAEADTGDIESVRRALEGAHTVFYFIASTIENFKKESEIKEGKSLVDAVVSSGAQYIIFSTLPHAKQISGHPVDLFDAKAEVEDYIRTLPIKSAFVSPGSYMQNFYGFSKPHPTGEKGTYSLAGVPSPETRVPNIDVIEDSGKFVAAILAEPEKFEGKVLHGAVKLYSYSQIADAISKATGKTVKYQQVPLEVFNSFFPPGVGQYFADMFLYFQDFGYYGPKSEEVVEMSKPFARGKLITFEELLERDPIQLD